METYSFLKKTLCLSLFMFLLLTVAKTIPPSSWDKIEKGQWIELDMSIELSNHLSTLTEDEQLEQFRDWVVFSFIQMINLEEAEQLQLLYDFSPMRYDFLRSVGNFQYGESRKLMLAKGELVIFVDKNSSQRRSWIARQADEYTLLNGERPKAIRIVDYIVDLKLQSTRFAYTEDIAVYDLFSKAFGFVEEQVSTQFELKSFLSKTDDLVAARRNAQGLLTLSGRRYENFQGKPITIEDIAVLYQADQNLVEQYVNRIGKRGLIQEFQNYKRQNKSDSKIDETIEALNSRLLLLKSLSIPGLSAEEKTLIETRIAEFESQIQELKAMKSAFNSYDDFKQLFIKSVSNADELNIGFSLDPQIKFTEFGNSLRKMANGDKALALRWYNETQRDSDKESIVFGRQQASEASKKIKDKPYDLNFSKFDLLTEQEINGHTLLFGSDSSSTGNKKGAFVNFIARQFDIDENELQSQTDEIFENTWESITAYKDLLLIIAAQLENVREEDNNRLSLMLQLRRYAEDDLEIEFNSSTNFEGSTDEARVNRLMLNHLVTALRYEGLLKKSDYKTYTSEVKEAVQKFQYQAGLRPTGIVDNRTMLELLEAEEQQQQKLSRLSYFLRNMQSTFSYQKARYDGYLQGTEVGMTLFYTDLVMKLWSFDFKNTAPSNAVFGFRPETSAPISSVYKLDIDKNSSTRSWLGPLESGYGFFKGGQDLYFSHIASTIFNASSNDLFPGKESDANISSDRFAQWWNSHYSEVADYEPEFHRLNQIMKWSTVVLWLKMKDQLSWLREVQKNLARNLEFSSWYQNNKSLRVQIPIPFDDPKKHGETTECLEILQSKPFMPFEDEFLVYSFSGGVSLVPQKNVVAKIQKPRPVSLLNSRMNRKSIDFSKPSEFTTQEISFLDGSKYKIDLKTKKVLVASKGHFRATRGELFGSNVEKLFVGTNRQITVSQKLGKTPLGELKAESTGNKVKLTATEAEASKYHRLFQDANKNQKGLEAKLFENDEVDFAYMNAPGQYLVKLKDAENSVLLRIEEIPVGPEAAQKAVRADYRHAFDAKNYLLGETKTPAETQALLANRWIKVPPKDFLGNVIELTTEPRIQSKGQSLYFFSENYSNEVVKYGNNLYFKTTLKNSQDWQVADVLSKSRDEIIAQFGGPSVEGYIFSEKGYGLAFSRNAGGRQVLDLVENLFPFKKSNLKAVIFTSDEKVRLMGKGILGVPRNVGPEQAEVAKFINSKAKQSEYLEILMKQDAISVENVRQLKQIKDENLELAKHFFEVDAIRNLEDGMAFVDMRSASLQPQMVVKSGQNPAQVLTLDKTFQQSLAESAKTLKAEILAGKTFTSEELIERTQPFNETQQAVAKKTGAKKIITAEFDGVNSEFVNRLHNEKPQTLFKRDQPNFERSVENASREIPIEYEGAIFLSSAELRSLGNEISNTFLKIQSSGVPCETGVTIERFEEILNDSTWKQITLVVRVNDVGLILANGVMSFAQLELELYNFDSEDGADKEFIHLVTNDGFRLTEVFSKSGRFQKIVTSNYQLGDASSFATTLDNVWSFYRVYSDQVNYVTKKELKKLDKKNPGAIITIGDRIQAEGKNFNIEVGKLSRKQKATLPDAVWRFFGEKLFGKGKTYQPQTIDSKLDETQLLRIRQFKSGSSGKISPGVFPSEKNEP